MLKKIIQKYLAWRCDRNLQALYKDLQLKQFAGIARTFGSLQTRNGEQEIDTKCCSESQACSNHSAAHEQNKVSYCPLSMADRPDHCPKKRVAHLPRRPMP